MNLSTDVLKMLQQQQSRQTELNHYVRQVNCMAGIPMKLYLIKPFDNYITNTFLTWEPRCHERENPENFSLLFSPPPPPPPQ
jgi:hypothetical protein